MRLFLALASVLFVGLGVSSTARAHFILQAPPSWAEQGAAGDPQKAPPCGPAAGEAFMATGLVTGFGVGATVTVTINETVAHPGHYRVALSTTGQSGLPADPTVTPVGADACGSKEIMNPPVFPVLADGMLPHTSAFSGPQTFTVKLPAGLICNANCVLQVTEYMQNHGAPCFYHHCANIAILPPDGTGGVTGTGTGGATGTGTGGATGTGAGGATGTGGAGQTGSDSGCSCATGAGRGSALGLLAALLVVASRPRAKRGIAAAKKR